MGLKNMKRHFLDMDPKEIRIKLYRMGLQHKKIAEQLGVSQQAVSRVIAGATVSHRIREEIARIIGEDIRRIWPSTYVMGRGHKKAGRPKTNPEKSVNQ
jgi:lambda repressor-like predicted transcriptional regulator